MSPITGLHHVTATVDEAQADLDLYTGLLGLRLVKRTVNFDNPGVYHFYYGDETGRPGTLMTTFPYRGMGVRPGRHGSGQVVTTAFAVPVASLGEWRERLEAGGARGMTLGDRRGEAFLRFADPSGLILELVETGDARTPWIGNGAPASLAIRGLHGVTLSVTDPTPTASFLEEVLGWSAVGTPTGARATIGTGGPGRTLDIAAAPDAARAINGLGTVHHVAMAVPTSEDQLMIRERLLAAGHQVTDVKDRCYFTSIYFREPGGVLIEVATEGPGFATDEPVETLGDTLRLPPWEEPRREAIEAALPRLTRPARLR